MKDIFDEMNREELLHFIRTTFSYRSGSFKKSDLLSYRWEKASDIHLNHMDYETAFLSKIDFKKRDELAVKFNNSSDMDEKSRLLEAMKKIDAEYNSWLKISDKTRKLGEKADKLYALFKEEME